MANKQEYIERLDGDSAIAQCGAIQSETVPVHEVFRGKTVWQGDVEVFDLIGHPKAKRCYGWSHGEPEEFIAILEFTARGFTAERGQSRGGVSNKKGQVKVTWP